ncbi:MAG: methyltransferase domain-containing protein, partial [Chloroflexota bacterium]
MARGRRIGRLKLNPPTPEIAKKYLFNWDNKTLYLNPETFPQFQSYSFFERTAPLNVDIGCGSGEFICALAQDHPKKYFVGIDISQKAIFTAVNNAANLGLDNIKFIKVDYKLLFPLYQPRTLENVYIYFPDPNYGG